MTGRDANWTPEARARARAKAKETLRGRPVSETTRTLIAKAQAGEKAHNWRGATVGYQGAHKRHRNTLPHQCSFCGQTDGPLDCALRNDTPLDRLLGCVKRKRLYSPHSDDYLRLCRSCHLRYDRVPVAA